MSSSLTNLSNRLAASRAMCDSFAAAGKYNESRAKPVFRPESAGPDRGWCRRGGAAKAAAAGFHMNFG
jgi:hypothetical protein